MLLQLTDKIPVDTPLGPGWAVLIDGTAHDPWWTVELTESRAFVSFRQEQLRAARSYSHGSISDFEMKGIVEPRIVFKFMTGEMRTEPWWREPAPLWDWYV